MANRADPSARFRGPSSHSGGRSWLQRRRSNRRVSDAPSVLLPAGAAAPAVLVLVVAVAASAISRPYRSRCFPLIDDVMGVCNRGWINRSALLASCLWTGWVVHESNVVVCGFA